MISTDKVSALEDPDIGLFELLEATAAPGFNLASKVQSKAEMLPKYLD